MAKEYGYGKKGRGVPQGYVHNWAYKGHWKEKKGKGGVWTGRFRATKGKKSSRYGKFKKGFKIKWKVWGTQTAVKTGKGKYQTDFRFKKKRIQSGYGKNYKKQKRQRY